MKFEVQDVSKQVVLDYIDSVPATDVPIWERVVLCRDTVVPMLFNGGYARERECFGLYIDGAIKGYAVVHARNRELDLVHIHDDIRGMGYGERFLRELNIEAVTVDSQNTTAVNLYTKLGYEVAFMEEE